MKQTDTLSTQTQSSVRTAPVSGLTDASLQRSGTTLITKHFDFEAAHYLPNVAPDHKCRRMHGHSYQIWIHVTGPMQEAAGWVVDFGDVKGVWKTLEGELDHHLLNEVPGLDNPTAENLAAWVWGRFEEARSQGLCDFSVAAVEVAETLDSRAMFVAPSRQAWVPGHPEVWLPATNGNAPSGDVQEVPAVATSSSEEAASGGADDHIEDVQARPDGRGVAIDEVGVSKVRMPIQVLDRHRGRQSTVAQVAMAANLAADVKGTHLSRFLQALRDHPDAFTLFSLSSLTGDVRARLGASRVRVRVEFPYFLTKAAPISGELGPLDVDAVFEVVDDDGELEHWLEVVTPITTVCPCSRDISDYGAHNQRGHVSIRVRCANDEAGFPTLVWIEELVELAEGTASAPVYSVVKRPDERHLTMRAYDNPKFVEDIVRDVTVALREDERIAAFEINIENDESIHAHNAFASVRGSQTH